MGTPDLVVDALGLGRRFGGVTALAGVDLAVGRGSVHALLGPNGAGKSTLIRILCTILRPDAGTARVLGWDVTRARRNVRRGIGVVGQFPTVDEHLTGRENLRLVGRLTDLGRAAARRRADELLARVALEGAADRRAGTYSGGMRRRLDLAAGIVHRPSLLLLDEPTTGLDPHARLEVWSLLRELVAEGTSILLTTQYLEEAERLADHITVLHEGKVAATGTNDELTDRFGRTVVDLVLDLDAVPAGIAALDRAPGVGHVEATGSKVRAEIGDPAQGIPAVVRALDAAGVTATRLAVREPNLDDVLLALTGDGAGSPVLGATR